jgi:uncharacterized phage protein gp47/JayE
MPGLSEKGFKIKKMAEIKTDIENDFNRQIDPNLNFNASSVAGTISAIVANQAAQVWESMAALYHALQPNIATGFSLDALCSLTGTYRKQGDFSKAEGKLFLEGNAKVPAGHAVKTTGGHIFKLDKEVVNSSSDEAAWLANFTAQDKGYILAHAETEAEIMNPESGWTKTVFTKTTYIGQLDETDDELRKRRISELKANGVSTVDALKSRLLEIPNVEGVYVQEENQAFRIFIKGGDEEKIAQTIWKCRPVGVKTTFVKGDILVPIDSPHVFIRDNESASDKDKPAVSFSRPQNLELVLSAEIKIKSKLSKEEDQAKKNEEIAKVKKDLADSLTLFAAKYFKMGAEVYNARFYATILNHPQVLDVTKLDIKCKNGSILPAVILPEQIASLQFNDISVLCSVVS